MTIVIATIFSLVFTPSATAQPSSPLMSDEFWQPMQLVPDIAFCANTQDAATLGACASGLTNEFRNSVGLSPNPPYSYVTLPGGTLKPLCGWAPIITLYCGDRVRLGLVSLRDSFTLGVNPQAYAAFLASHEATHHSQVKARGRDLTDIFLSPAVKPFEQQADCIGGLTIAYYVAQGRFTYSDAQGIESVFKRASTTETHGSSEDRINAFRTGYEAAGVSDCIGGVFANLALV